MLRIEAMSETLASSGRITNLLGKRDGAAVGSSLDWRATVATVLPGFVRAAATKTNGSRGFNRSIRPLHTHTVIRVHCFTWHYRIRLHENNMWR
jgi:hypothetical protein